MMLARLFSSVSPHGLARRLLWAGCGAALLLAGPALAYRPHNQAPTPEPLSEAWQVPLVTRGAGPYYRVALPWVVLASSRHADLRDLSVVDQSGQPVPFSLMQPGRSDKTTQQVQEVPLFPLAGRGTASPSESVVVVRGADGAVVSVRAKSGLTPVSTGIEAYVLDVTALRAPLQALELHWDERDGGQTFHGLRVEASEDLQSWRPWGDARVARLDNEGQRILLNRVDLPGESARFLRLSWQQPASAPRLTRVVARAEVVESGQAPLTWSPPLTTSGQYEQHPVYALRYPVPVVRMQLRLAGDKLVSPLKVQVPNQDARQPWRVLTEAHVYRVVVDGKARESQDLDLSGQALERFALRLEAAQARGKLAEVRVAVPSQELVFLASGPGPYQIRLGEKQRNLMALGQLVPGYGGAQAPRIDTAELELAKAAAAPAVAVVAPVGDDTNWRRIALWAVLLVGVLLLAGFAWHLIRHGAGDEPQA